MKKLVLIAALVAAPVLAQQQRWTLENLPAPAPTDSATNRQPNPYVAEADFLKMPPGRTMGSTSAVAIDSKGHIWVADRCGANSCLDSPLDPIMEFDQHGNFIKAFGAGLFVFPHGITIDSNDNIWLTDPRTAEGAQRGNEGLSMHRWVLAALLVAASAVPAAAQHSYDKVTISTETLARGVAVLFGTGGVEIELIAQVQ